MSRLVKLLRYAALAKKQSGKSYLRQGFEALRGAAAPNRLGLSEYYEFEVFNDRHYPGHSKQGCVGWRASANIDARLNHNHWRACANDKVLNYAMLAHYGFPIPEAIATYSTSQRRIGDEPILGTPLEVRDFLRQPLPYPVFVKPMHGSYGRGTYLLTAFDTQTDCFTTPAEDVPLAGVVKACQIPQFKGMLFQKCLQPHETIHTLVGPTTSCVRLIVAFTETGPHVHMAFWKIARAHNITDNFCMGETGNLLASIDKDTGAIQRVVTGLWPHGQEITHHPDTQQPFNGFTLPDWSHAIDLCLAASHHFLGLRLQHWDIAFCQQGPVLMELNTEADLGVPQFLDRTPFVNDRIADMLRQH